MAKHYNFGTGNLFVLPVGGGDPLQVGALQDVGVDFSGDVKSLYGQSQYPLDVARGKVKIEIKAKSGLIDIDLYNTLFFGLTATTGEKKAAFSEAGSGAIPATPFQLTVTNGATFDTDLGVYNAADGTRFKQVVSGPTAGQYSVSGAGVYTFATADTGKLVLFNYLYNSTTTGRTLSGTNPLMGTIPTFQLNLANISKTKTQAMTFFSVVCPKLSLPFKQDDYQIGDLDLLAFDNGAGQVFKWSATG